MAMTSSPHLFVHRLLLSPVPVYGVSFGEYITTLLPNGNVSFLDTTTLPREQ